MPKRRTNPNKKDGRPTPSKRKAGANSEELEGLADRAAKLRMNSIKMTEASKSGYLTPSYIPTSLITLDTQPPALPLLILWPSYSSANQE